MADFITPVASIAELTTWYTSTVPASIPSGDRYIAELAAGDYTFTGVTWTGKTLVSAGQLVIRAASAARMNAAAPARFKSSGAVVLLHSFGAVNAFGSNVALGFVFEDIQFNSNTNGQFQIVSGGRINRCLYTKQASGATNFQFNGTGLATNCIFIRYAGITGGVTFGGTGAQNSNTFLGFDDSSIIGLSGSFQNAAWKNNVALNLSGGSADPWPTPPTSFFSGASNNATSFATQGNCPGTSAVVAASGAANFANVGSAATLDATPLSGAALRNAGVVAASNDGVDWYNTTRPGTPGIGATEYQAPASILGGNVTADDVAPGGAFGNAGASSVSGNVAFDDVAPAGSFGLQPGTITSSPFKNWGGTLLALTVIPKLAVVRVSDMATVLTLTDQTTNASGVLAITHAALTPGLTYLLIASDATGAACGCEAYTVG